MDKIIKFNTDFSIYKKGELFKGSDSLTRLAVSRGVAKFVEDEKLISDKKAKKAKQ